MCRETINQGVMNKNEFQKKSHEQRKQLHDDRIIVESERGWAGQHGQHPESVEEEDYHPHTPAPDKEEHK